VECDSESVRLDPLTRRAGGCGAHRNPLGRRGRGGDDGMVTAELAVGLFAVVLIMAMMIFAIAVVTTQLKSQEAARAGARAAARGDADDAVISSAQRVLAGASVQIYRDDLVRVQVTSVVSLPFGALRIPAFTTQANSVAEAEE
jgi:hypothetical protein